MMIMLGQSEVVEIGMKAVMKSLKMMRVIPSQKTPCTAVNLYASVMKMMKVRKYVNGSV
jgi:hypothetical protein